MTPRFYFLLATVLTLPLAIRKVIWAVPSPLFKEYSDVSIYAFEIFLVGYILLSILEHKEYIKSIYRKVFHVEHLLILLLLALSSIIAALLYGSLHSLVFLLRWVVYIVFATIFYKDLQLIVPRGTIIFLQDTKKCSTWNNLPKLLLIPLFFEAVIVLTQIITQHSIGFFYIGEPVLDVSIAGVTTIIIAEKEFLRGYGTFLHPNITAFFFFVYGLTYILFAIVPRGTIISKETSKNCSMWNTLGKYFSQLFHVEQLFPKKRVKIVPCGTYMIIYWVILVGFLFTFSKAVLGVVILLGLRYFYIIKCSTWNNQKYFQINKLFHVEQFRFFGLFKNVPRGTIITIVFIALIFGIKEAKLPGFISQSILERKIQYLSIPVNTTSEFLVGQGLGNYTQALAEKSPGLYLWQLQPIHNVYILALVELGLLPVLGITVYMWLKWQKYHPLLPKKLTDQQKWVLFIAGALALLLAVDHYFWDIEQGQFLFVLLVTVLTFLFHNPLPKNRE